MRLKQKRLEGLDQFRGCNTQFDAVWWNISVTDLDLVKVELRYFMRPPKCWPEFSRKQYEIEKVSLEVRNNVMYVLSNSENILDLMWSSRVEGQNPKNFEVEYLGKRYEIERKCQ